MLLVEAIGDGLSMVCRVSRGKETKPLSFWCAYYGPTVLANKWEPFDQPRPEAYMPYRLAEFNVTTVGTGVVLVKKTAQHSVATLRRGALTNRNHAKDAVEAAAMLRGLFQPYGVENLEPLVMAQCMAL